MFMMRFSPMTASPMSPMSAFFIFFLLDFEIQAFSTRRSRWARQRWTRALPA
jgi:hypothetical protein